MTDRIEFDYRVPEDQDFWNEVDERTKARRVLLWIIGGWAVAMAGVVYLGVRWLS